MQTINFATNEIDNVLANEIKNVRVGVENGKDWVASATKFKNGWTLRDGWTNDAKRKAVKRQATAQEMEEFIRQNVQTANAFNKPLVQAKVLNEEFVGAEQPDEVDEQAADEQREAEAATAELEDDEAAFMTREDAMDALGISKDALRKRMKRAENKGEDFKVNGKVVL